MSENRLPIFYTNYENALDVFLRNGFLTTNKVKALVDSGADFPIAPMDLAEELKLDLTHATVRQFSGTTGVLQNGKLADVSVVVLTENGDRAFEIKSKCAFCDTFKFAGGMLLGQDEFFSHFRTTFAQPSNYFEIEPWKEVD